MGLLDTGAGVSMAVATGDMLVAAAGVSRCLQLAKSTDSAIAAQSKLGRSM